MVRPRAGAFLAADRGAPGIEQVAEKLPSRRRLVESDSERFGDPVCGAARRHRARDAGQSPAVARCETGVRGQQRETVRRRDEDAAPDDQVPVAVAIRGGAELGGRVAHHQLEERARVVEVRVRMAAAEIGQRRPVDDGSRRRTEPSLENLGRVRPRRGMHRVEPHPETAREQRADRFEVEQGLHQRRVVRDRVDHLDHGLFEALFPHTLEIEIRCIRDPVGADRPCAVEHRVRHALRCGATVLGVVLDPEIAVRTTRIVGR